MQILFTGAFLAQKVGSCWDAKINKNLASRQAGNARQKIDLKLIIATEGGYNSRRLSFRLFVYLLAISREKNYISDRDENFITHIISLDKKVAVEFWK